MKIISSLVSVLLVTGILGLSAVPIRADEGFGSEDIITTDFDPSDDIHGDQIVLKGRLFGWSYNAHGLAAAFGLLLKELGTAIGPLVANTARRD